MDKETRRFTIIFSVVFFGLLFILRGISENSGLVSSYDRLLRYSSSSIISASIVVFIFKKYKLGVVMLTLGLLLVSLLLLPRLDSGTQNDENLLSVGSEWKTNEREGSQYKFIFLSQDSMSIAVDSMLESYKYNLNKGRLSILDSLNTELVGWSLEIDDDKMTLLEGGDYLVLYKF